MSDETPENNPPSSGKHLFVLIHGFFGNPSHLSAMRDTLSSRFSEDEVEILVPKGNAGLRSFDGVRLGAERVVEELGEFLKERRRKGVKFTHISIAGYSLGGLYARYVVGILYKNGFFDKVTPVTFTTFATPHLGSKFYHENTSSKILNFLGSNLLGVSGNDMFGVNSTVLRDMADPDKPFYQGLQQFEQLILFANAIHDRTVPFFTSFICEKDPFKRRDFVNYVYHEYDGEEELFVDMAESRYRETSNGIDVYPTSQERQFRWYAMLGMPIVFPIVLMITSMTTIVSKHRVQEAYRSDTLLLKRSSHSEGIADLTFLAINDILLEDAEPTEIDTEPASSASSTTKTPLISDTKTRGEVVEGHDGAGNKGLVDSTPHKLDLPSETKAMAESLNQLPWRKYVIKLQRMHSHAEIVNRRNLPGQGQKVLEMWVNLVQSKV
ncbi:lipid droplet phospholipase 1 [Trichomonascus vanleenenianus]|uniref:lipase ROG1 family protein n=1 Tax=Trichomonascus vanleenenianus TaxID=2268995 RepID=UPI003ECA9556